MNFPNFPAPWQPCWFVNESSAFHLCRNIVADPGFPKGRQPKRWGANLLLPPATKLGQGYIFTGICDSVHRGGLPQYMLGYHTPWQDRPPQQGRPLWQGRPPYAVHAGRYGQQAGGMNPTGMQFLFWSIVLKNCTKMKRNWTTGVGGAHS